MDPPCNWCVKSKILAIKNLFYILISLPSIFYFSSGYFLPDWRSGSQRLEGGSTGDLLEEGTQGRVCRPTARSIPRP